MSHRKRNTSPAVPPFAGIGPIAGGVALAALLAACGGGGGGSSVPINQPPVPIPGQPTPTAAPSPSATPTGAPTPVATLPPGGAGVGLSSSSLSFTSAGQTISVAAVQAQNTTGFNWSSKDCTGKVSLAPTTGPGPFAFTAVAAGTCTYTVTGISGATAALNIVVTTTVITPQ